MASIYNSTSNTLRLGTSNADFIENSSGKYVTILAQGGNDTIENHRRGSNSYIDGGESDDNIYNIGENVTIIGGVGNDKISLSSYAENVLIKYASGDGNDIIYGFKDNSTLSIGGSYSSQTSGDNIIVTVDDGKISLVGAAGLEAVSAVNIIGEKTSTPPKPSTEENSWKLSGTTATYGTSKKTLVTVKGVKSLGGISLSGKVVTVAASSLNKKKVSITGSGYTLKLADDVTKTKTKKAAWSLSNSTATYKSSYKTAGYKLSSDSKSISYTKATTAKALATIQGAKSTKGLSVSDGAISLKGSALSNKVTVGGGYRFYFIDDYNNATITGSSNVDSIINDDAYNVLINSGDGADWIFNGFRGSLSAINGGTGNDTVYNGGNRVTINGGKGNDYIYNYDGNNDDINNYSDGSLSAINGGDGADYIYNAASKVTINGGEDNDYIQNYYSGSRSEINGGAGNDSISNRGNEVTIDGGENNDYIESDVDNVTISGGKGNDSISLGDRSSNNLIEYSSGEGNDIIYGVRADSTLQIGGGEYSTTKSGKNIIVTVGDGKISLIGAASLGSSLNIAGTKKVTTPSTLLTVNNSTKSPVTVGSAVKVINASSRTNAVKITGNKLANSIAGGSGNDTLNGGKGNDTLTGGKGKDIFVYSAGNDLITDYAAEDKISITSGTATFTASGNDIIINGKITVKNGKDKTITYSDSSGKNKKYEYEEETSDDEIVTLPKTYSKESYTMGNGVFTLDASAVRLDLNVVGNKFANKIIGSDQNDTLEGGKANDTLTGNGGSDVFVYNDGDGNDLITDYTEDEDIIQIKGKVGKITPSGKDIIVTVGTGKISLKGSADKIISYIDEDGEHTYGDTISPVEVKGKTVTLSENYTADSFDLSGYAKTIKTVNAAAVTRDLKITANTNANSILGGSGNDTLIGGKGNDSIAGGDGSDVFIYNSGDGNDLITDYAEEDKIQIASVTAKVKKSSSDVIFTVGIGKITVKGAATKTVTYIDADGKTNYYPTTPKSQIIHTDDNKTAILRETYSDSTYTAGSAIKKIDASAVARDLSITGNGKANIILGGYEDDTLIGGKGNDTLQGGSGADVFTYANGDGKDIILDYSEEDTIKITKGTAKVAANGNDVVFTIGSGKITLAGAASKTVTYIESGKTKTYGNSTANVLEDDNFITGNDLSALVESKPADYFAVQESLIQKNNLLPSMTLSSKK